VAVPTECARNSLKLVVYDFPSSTPQVEEAHRNDEDKNDEERRKKLGDQATAERIPYNRKGGG
jgi:hypothetical protein